LKSPYRVSDSIQASQVCVELSVKAILTLLDIQFPRSHSWTRQELGAIAKQIHGRDLASRLAAQYLDQSVRLPRLLLLVNLWSQFYLEAKYGLEAGHLAPAQDLFAKAEAELAAMHAEECLSAARTLRHLPQDKLAALTTP
jgi:hypothetical protein